MITILNTHPSLLNDFLAELRDVSVQTDRAKFRSNITRIGEVMAYEISKVLDRKMVEITSPLGSNTSLVLSKQPVLATVLRAGLPMHQGFVNYFDKADSAFVSAFREHTDAHSFEIKMGYLASPDLNGRTLILIDPMLATGRSMYQSYLALLKRGKPGRVIVASLIGSEQGLDYIKAHIPEADIYLAVIDPLLNEDSYIVPGLGDAGDLCFGEKL